MNNFLKIIQKKILELFCVINCLSSRNNCLVENEHFLFTRLHFKFKHYTIQFSNGALILATPNTRVKHGSLYALMLNVNSLLHGSYHLYEQEYQRVTAYGCHI